MKILKTVIKKIRREGIRSILGDLFYYLPMGIYDGIVETPEGIKMDLKGLSPVTRGRFIAGNAEIPERECIPHIPDGVSIIELGAGTGYISALLNRKTKKHILIEPNPFMIPIIESTRWLNKMKCEIIHAAYHPSLHNIEFPNTKYYKTASLDDDYKNKVVVRAISLKELFKTHDLPNCILYVDIEGSEKLLFENEMEIIFEKCRGVFIEFHPHITGMKFFHDFDSRMYYEKFLLVSRSENVSLYLR